MRIPTRKILWLQFGVFLCIQYAQALEINYLDMNQVGSLQASFESARPLSHLDLSHLNNSQWTCDMYGVASRLQVEKNVALYAFVVDSRNRKLIHNKGAQRVKKYLLHKGLSGQKSTVLDEIRLASTGELFSKLSLLEPRERTLVYSRCHRI